MAQGLPSAMYDYGVILEHGMGVPVDETAGKQWPRGAGRGAEPGPRSCTRGRPGEAFAAPRRRWPASARRSPDELPATPSAFEAAASGPSGVAPISPNPLVPLIATIRTAGDRWVLVFS